MFVAWRYEGMWTDEGRSAYLFNECIIMPTDIEILTVGWVYSVALTS